MTEDVYQTIRQLSIIIPPVLLAVSAHEASHGWMAYKFGDHTARDAGRLTLNPLKHLDLVGTIVLLVTRMIGWAKPVPVNPRNLKDPLRDMLWVSLAGPGANMILAVISAGAFQMLAGTAVTAAWLYKILVPVYLMMEISVTINVGLAIFNLIPVPPLDGSKILMGLLPKPQAMTYARLEPYGFIVLLVLIFSGITEILIFPIIELLVHLLLGA